MAEVKNYDSTQENSGLEDDDMLPPFNATDINVEIYQNGIKIPIAITETSSFRKKKGKRKHASIVSEITVNNPSQPLANLPEREATKELLETWRIALQTNRQVCCPLPDCQLSYCSIRGLMLHYRNCTGQRNDDEIVKCKICCNYVSGRISLAHHNRLLHSGKPAKSLDTFMESQYHAHTHRSSDVRTTKSMRQVRKPARYREGGTDSKNDQANKSDDFTQNLSPVTINKTRTAFPNATITRVAPGSYKKEDFPESVLKSSFLYHIGLAPTDVHSSVLVLEEEVEDKLPPPKNDVEEFKSPQVMCSELRTRFKQLYPRPKVNKEETTVVQINKLDTQIIGKRKRGRPRKIRPEDIASHQHASALIKSEVNLKPSKRKRRRKHEMIDGNKISEKPNDTLPHEFVTITVCGECWEEFGDPESFSNHVRTKHSGTQQEQQQQQQEQQQQEISNVENEKLMRKKENAKLQKTMHKNGILTCQNCKKPLLSITGYQSHIKNCKVVENSSPSTTSDLQTVKKEPEKEKICRECNAPFPTQKSFEEHCLLQHQGLCRLVGDHRPFSDEERLAAQKKTLKEFGSIPCPNCPKSYVSLQGLQYHLRTCKTDVQFSQFIDTDISCNVCNVTYSTMQEFRDHAISIHNGLAKPVGENRPFTNAEKLNILQQVLRLNKKLSCLNDGCGKDFKTVLEYLEHEELCKTLKGSDSVVCGVCHTGFANYGQFTNHAMNVHNGLARIVGKRQTFKDDEELVILRKTLQTVKKLHCLRQSCGKTFISLGGYQYHTKICGKDSVIMVECEICGKRLREASMKTHMKMSHPPLPPVKQDLPQPRNAAKRAREKVSKIAKKLISDDDGNALPIKKSEHVNNVVSEDVISRIPQYQKPTQHISNEMFNQWKKVFETSGRVVCSNSGCEEEFLDLKEFQKHFTLCSRSKMKLCYVCSLCGKRCRTEGQMQYHVEKHLNSNNNDEVDAETETKDNSELRSCYGKCPVPIYRSHEDFETFHPAAEWTKDFLKKNCSSYLFSHWQPTRISWSLLNPNEYEIFLPKEEESISFQTLDLVNQKEVKSEWTKLRRFFSFSKSGDSESFPYTFFVGGPVWALSWCPTPPNKTASQYLALTSSPSMEDIVPSPHDISKPGLIQLWKISNDNSSEKPEFVLGITHKFGIVWALEWCPSGCWEGDLDAQSDENFPRLGLLAAACSDGRIYIYSVPEPTCLSKSNNNLPIFKTNPTVILQNDPVLSVGTPNLNYQCISMSWLRFKGHTKIAGGFTNGYVAVWDITVDSPLLRKMSSSNEVIFGPCRLFQAHSTFVQDVIWAPFSDGRFLATVGSDRQLLFWSIEDLSWPCNTYKFGRLLKIDWSPHWCGAFVSGDDCYNLWHNSLRFVESGYFSNNSRCLTPHNGCIWDMSLNDWLNCSVSCDSSGEVVGTVLPQLFHGIGNVKNFHRKRFSIYRTTLFNLKLNCEQLNEISESEENYDDFNDENDKEDEEVNPGCDQMQFLENSLLDSTTDAQCTESENNKPTAISNTESNTEDGKPSSYEEMVNNYGLIYLDCVLDSSDSQVKEENRRLKNPRLMTQTNLDMFPITSINRVAWNPNLGSHLLVASGGQSGLVRIHRINCLKEKNVEKTMEDLQVKPKNNENCQTVVTKSNQMPERIVNCEVNCTVPVKVNQIEWLHQANIEKIRTALQIQSGQTKYQDGETNEKTIPDDLPTNCSSDLLSTKFLSAQSSGPEVAHS